ncbi:hypothetical protein ACHAXT_007986 [Thalassiosira profunda]
MMIGSSLGRGALGALALLSSLPGARADASSYFSALSSAEKEPFTAWLADRSSSYDRNTFLPSAGDPEDGAVVFWRLADDTVHFAVAARAEGWVGFGLSEAGGMTGSDVALFEAATPSELVDAHVVESKSVPLTDDCQDWSLNNAVSEDGWTIVEMSRLLDTGDNQDHSIKRDENLWDPPTRIIAAWGDSDTVAYHGGSKARGSVRLYANHADELTEMEALLEVLEEQSDSYFEVREDQFEIPQKETHYQEVCKTVTELGIDIPEGQEGITMVGVVPIIPEETRKFIHHFTVYLQSDCTSMSNFLTRSMLYAWAPGDEGWALPDDVGFPMFSEAGNQAIFIQTHYDNPDLVPGMKDSSGLRFFYTNEERAQEAALMEIGDPWLSLGGETVGDGLSKYSFTCPGACSSFFLGTERSGSGVTILGENLHMHQTGVRMTNEVIRGEEVVHTAVSEVYDFEQQGGFHVPQEPYQFLPGDSWRTTCYYEDGTKFGLASSEEMCIAFILYYPRAKHPLGSPWQCPYLPFTDFGTGCAGELEQSSLSSAEELGRSFGTSSGDCEAESNVDEPVSAPTESVPTETNGAPSPPVTADVPAPSPSATPDVPVVVTVPVPDGPASAGWTAASLIFSTATLLLSTLLLV